MADIYIKLIECIELENIYLSSSHCDRLPSSDFKGDIQTNIGVAQRLEYQTTRSFVASVNFIINAFDELDENNKLFQMDFNFILEYKLSEDIESSCERNEFEDAINMFIKRNVPVNAWPYGREFISQMTSRMGLPQLIIGTYKYFPSIEDGEEE